jgi:uncharacterized protein involved in type VI secretion and phage assembly
MTVTKCEIPKSPKGHADEERQAVQHLAYPPALPVPRVAQDDYQYAKNKVQSGYHVHLNQPPLLGAQAPS